MPSAVPGQVENGSFFAAIATLDVDDTIAALVARFGPTRVTIASSFAAEDMILVDAAARVRDRDGKAPRVFMLDTGRLPEETWRIVETARARYRLDVEIYAPDASDIEDLVRAKGPFSFHESVDDRKACCHVRKVKPLARALADVDAWVTGLRRAQSVTRTDVERVARDDAHGGIWKVAPLAAWSEADVWQRTAERDIPIHALHRAGFPSIGCAPCTRAVDGWAIGGDALVDIRSGRWWWEDPSHKECGLHARPGGRS